LYAKNMVKLNHTQKAMTKRPSTPSGTPRSSANQPPQEGRNAGLLVRRQVFDLKGQPLGTSLKRGDHAVVVLSVTSGEVLRDAVIIDRLPAGLEPVDVRFAAQDAGVAKQLAAMQLGECELIVEAARLKLLLPRRLLRAYSGLEVPMVLVAMLALPARTGAAPVDPAATRAKFARKARTLTVTMPRRAAR
jgi:hypothetical protein